MTLSHTTTNYISLSTEEAGLLPKEPTSTFKILI
jgi:hypothetical protein